MKNLCESYFLRDNPFPTTPILDPNSDDDRANGRIYNRHIMEREIQSFESKIRQQPPLIYIENSIFERGVGKSALVVQQWRQLQAQREVTSVYLRSEQRWKPIDFAARLIDRWHVDGYLWPAVLLTLEEYVKSSPQSEMPPAAYSLFKEKLPKLPLHQIGLERFNVYNPSQLVTNLAALASKKAGGHLPLELSRAFFESYLTYPMKFPDVYPAVLRKQKLDAIAMLAGVYRLLRLGGYLYNYLFFDQFEDVVHGMTGKTLITFNTEMRRLIEASIGCATITVTLHPGATDALRTHEGGDIVSLAPLDTRSVVDVRPLTKEGVHQLALTYLNHFRLPNVSPPNDLYPFTNEAIDEIHAATRGNMRASLQAFNFAIERGIDEECAIIDRVFLIKHHADITGRVHPEEINL